MYERIISLAPSNTEILYALGAEDRLVACTRYCDYPPEAAKKPRVGGWLDIKEELVLKYKKLGLNIVALMPTTLVGVFYSIEKIGKLVGKEKEAQRLIRDMNKKIKKIKEKSRFADYTPRLYIEEWHKPPTISGNWVPTLARIARADYSLIRAGYHSREVTIEEIQKYNPQYIIMSICGLSNKAPKEWVTKRPGWENLSAVKNNHVFVFDDSLLNRPGPRLVHGLEMIANVLHPEVFHDKTIQELIKQ